MKKDYRNNIRKYYILCTCVGIAFFLLWIALVFAEPSYIILILYLFVMLILNKLIVRIIANKTLFSVLVKELDANSFNAIVRDKRFKMPIVYKTIAAISIGDYQTAVKIATKQIDDPKSKIQLRYYSLSVLARVYFELRDFEKLNLVIKKYDELYGLYPSKNIDTLNSIWDYYRYFLECNFEACKAICKTKENTLKNKSSDNNYYIIINDFYYAVVCYSAGNMEEAARVFDKIIHTAPKMHLSNISKRYLDSIDSSSELTVFDEFIPEENY